MMATYWLGYFFEKNGRVRVFDQTQDGENSCCGKRENNSCGKDLIEDRRMVVKFKLFMLNVMWVFHEPYFLHLQTCERQWNKVKK